MAQFYFDLLNGSGLTLDEDGVQLPDLGAAHSRAMREARSIMSHEVLEGELDLRSEIIVREGERERLRLRFWEALQVRSAEEEGEKTRDDH